jgi:prepilin-type processing-associated H-X9-DG protein
VRTSQVARPDQLVLLADGDEIPPLGYVVNGRSDGGYADVGSRHRYGSYAAYFDGHVAFKRYPEYDNPLNFVYD